MPTLLIVGTANAFDGVASIVYPRYINNINWNADTPGRVSLQEDWI